MKVYNLADMVGGWFVGNFDPSVLKTNQFEVGIKEHPKGSKWDVHFHKVATEITLLVKGKMKMHGKFITAGQIFVLDPYEAADPEFVEDCLVVVVKTPSVMGDKYVVQG